MKQFTRGEKSKLSDLTPLENLIVGVGVQAPGSPEFDVSCFGVDENGNLSDDRYFVFFNQKRSPEGEIEALGPQNGNQEAFRVNLSNLPRKVQKLVFTITLDGVGTMSQVSRGHLSITAGGSEVAKFSFSGSDFAQEKAVIVGEIYRKDVWRLSAVGQGFNGGLSALLEHFGGEEIEDNAPAPAQPTATDLSKRVQLDKKLERQAPQLLSLAKKAQVSLEKANLTGHRAKVALCLDVSGSMSQLFSSGKIQRFAEKILALSTRFDDDGSIDVFIFADKGVSIGEMTVDNFPGFAQRCWSDRRAGGGTNYGKVMRLIRNFYFPNGRAQARKAPVLGEIPVYVMFLTDGETMDPDVSEKQIRWAAYEPIFWQFMGIDEAGRGVDEGIKAMVQQGLLPSYFNSNFPFLTQLDELGKRYIDNANFFSVEDPEAIGDNELYSLMMQEYPSWVRQAPSKNLLP